MSKKWRNPKPTLRLRATDAATNGDVQLRATADAAELTLEASESPGKLPTFTMSAYNGGPMRPSGWYAEEPIILDLEGMEIPASVPIDSNHSTDIGHTTKLEKATKSLRASGVLSSWDSEDDDMEATAARTLVRKAKNGFPFQASVDVRAVRSKIEHFRAGESVRVNGRTFEGPVYVARATKLRKIAILSDGADSTTETKIAAKPGETMDPKFTAWLQAKGIDPTKVDESVKKIAQAAWEAEMKAANPPAPTPAPAKDDNKPDPIAELRAGAVAEARRIAEVTAICAKASNPEIEINGAKVSLQAHAIAEGWTVDKTRLEAQAVELAALRASRVQAPFAYVASGAPQPTNEILEAALCLRAGLPKIETRFKSDTLEVADKHYRDIGIQQVFLMAAAQNGYNARPGETINSNGKLREVMKHAFLPLQASSSSFSLPNILGAVAYKELLTGYMEEDQAWRRIAKIKPVNNFYQRTYMRLLDNMVYEQLGPNGEIKHGSISEETYTSQAKTYAKMFALTRESIINDDLGAFDDIRARLGRGAAQRFNVVFWTAFINNSSFFTSGRTNYISGSTTNLGTDGVGLGLAVKAIRQMTSPSTDGSKHVGAGIVPKILVVPPELEQIAEQLYRNQNLGSGTTVGNANIYANKYEPVVAWQLSNSSYTGYSTTAWYLFGDTTINAPMLVTFLNGQQTPTVEAADADFDTLGVQFRGYHDFGADQADYLCGLKSKGAA